MDKKKEKKEMEKIDDFIDKINSGFYDECGFFVRANCSRTTYMPTWMAIVLAISHSELKDTKVDINEFPLPFTENESAEEVIRDLKRRISFLKYVLLTEKDATGSETYQEWLEARGLLTKN